MYIKYVPPQAPGHKRQVTMVFAPWKRTGSADRQVQGSSKGNGRMKRSFKNIWNALSFDIGLPKKKSKREGMHVSWPQNVVKTVEHGQSIDRAIDIQNPHERLVQTPPRAAEAGQSAGEAVGQTPPETVPSSRTPSPRRKHQIQRTPPRKVNYQLFSPHIDQAPPPAAQAQNVNTGHTTIKTDDVREFMSEPRTSWPQSASRMEHLVSRFRSVKPQLRVITQTSPSEAVDTSSSHVRTPTADPKQPGSSDAQPQEERKQRPPFVYPNPIAVKRHAWRYSVDAEEACHRERVKHRYSMHGDGFRDLIPTSITDPAILDKIAEIRRQQQESGPAPGPTISNGLQHPEQGVERPSPHPTDSNSTQEHISPQIASRPSRASENHSQQSLRQNSVELPPSSNGLPSAHTSQLPEESEIQDDIKPNRPNPLAEDEPDFNMEEVAPPKFPERETATPIPHELHSQPSSLSSNVRTPTSYYPSNYVPKPRIKIQVIAKPVQTKAEVGRERRQRALIRNPPDRLKEKQEQSLGREEFRVPSETLWRSGPIVLGQVTYDTVQRTRVEVLEDKDGKLKELKAPIVGLAGEGVEYARTAARPHRVLGSDPPTPPNSPVPSALSDLLSVRGYPKRLPETSRSFAPPPSQAVVPHRKGHNAPVEPAIPEDNALVLRDPTPWDLLRNRRMSSEEGKELLYEYIRRPLDPIEDEKRQDRLYKSQYFFTSEYKPQKPQSIPKRMACLASSLREIARESPSVTRLSQVDIIYITRLLSTKEITPYPNFQEQLRDPLALFLEAWPVAIDLGLRPLAMCHFLHEDSDIVVFLSTEDEALYLWSPEWDVELFGSATLLRAGLTLEDCERGIREGLHRLEFERGGWLKLDGYEEDWGIERPTSAVAEVEEEDIYGEQVVPRVTQQFAPMQI